MRRPLLLALGALSASSVGAGAVGFRTQINCASDYYAYCSKYSPGSAEVRKCMRANGPRLSKACIGALIADGEISKEEVERTKERLAAAKAKPKAVEAKKPEVATAKIEPAKPEVAASKIEPRKPEAKIAAAPAKVTPKPVATASAAPGTHTESVVAQAPMAKVARVERIVPPQLEIQPVTRQTVSLDHETFMALKARGSRFVVADEPPAEAIALQQRPVKQAVAPHKTQPQPIRSATGDAVEIDQPLTPDPTARELRTEPRMDVASEGIDSRPGRRIEYPPGRMSLGQKMQEAREDEQQPSWWDNLVRTLTGGE